MNPVHFNDAQYRNSNEHCCGADLMVGACTDFVVAVTCPDCLAKMAGMNITEHVTRYNPVKPNKTPMYISPVNGTQVFGHSNGWIIYTVNDKFLKRVSKISLEAIKDMVDNPNREVI